MRILCCANLFPKRGKRAHIGKIIQLVAWLVIFSLPLQAKVRSQELVSLSFKNGSLENVLKEIRRQTGYLYALQDQWKGEARPIDIDVTNVSLDEALGIIFKEQPFSYSIIGKTIVVKERENISSRDDRISPPPLHVKGTVYNEAGQPLAGANVTIKETKKGTITDAKGEFEISAPQASTLIISFIGYAPEHMMVKEGMDIKIHLKETKDQLDKAVVQAYGTTTQRLATGDIGTVTAEQIARQPVTNVLEALQGQVAGVIVTNQNSYATSTVKVEIRGRNTINQNFPSDPLYIIDGVPLTILELTNFSNYNTGSQGIIQSGLASPAVGQSPFFSMNPDDIESIEVLKDADATAIYGSRGSNGVILITTKKGKAGKIKFNMNVEQGTNQDPKYYKMLNTRQYVAMREEALTNDGLPMNINNAPDLVQWDTAKYTNWQKYMYGGLGKQTDARLGLSGGDNRLTFRLGGEYLRETDILNYSGANQRGSLSLNLNSKSLNQRISVGLSASYSIVSSNQINVPSAINLPPNAPAIFDANGNLNYAGWAPLGGAFPFGTYLQPYSTKTSFLNASIPISYEIAKGLIMRTNFGYNNIQTTQTSYITIASQDPANNPTGTSQNGLTFINNVIIEPQIEYNGFIGNGKLGVLAGATSQTNSTTADFLQGFGYTTDAFISNFSAAAPGEQLVTNSGGQYKYDAVFGRINYNWENKYLINLNARRDGSSKFGPGRQYGNFGSVGVAWVFSEEDWVRKNLAFLSFGKIRGSYGNVGGDQIGNYAYLSLWQYQRSAYNGILPLIPLGHTDSALQWQVNRKAEIAVDFGFLKDRISFELSVYRNRTDNQLVTFPTPAFTGFSLVTANSPADVQNAGWELLVNSKIIDSRQFRWSAKFNIGINRNKLLAYPNLSQSPYAGTLIIGQSLNIRKVLHYTGIDPQTGEYSFEDKNHDGQITYSYSGGTDDTYPINMSPKYDGGFTTDLNYHNFGLSLFFYFRRQLGNNAFQGLDAPGDETNQPTAVLNHWTKPGSIAPNPKYTTEPPFQAYANFTTLSDAAITDASFIRLQNVALTYSISSPSMKKAFYGPVKLFIEGKNLFIISRYNGLDPEIQNFNSMPLPRTIVLGLSADF